MKGFKSVFYQHYVNDIYILFKSNDHLKYFQDFLNSFHINMSFSMEAEKQNTSYPYSTLKLYMNKVNLQPQFIEDLLFVVYIVTLKMFYLWFMNLVWYILWFIDVFAFAQIGHSSYWINFSERNISKEWLPWKLYW